MRSIINESAAETLLRNALLEAKVGRHSTFLQKLEDAMRMNWKLVMPSLYPSPSADAVELATLREVARALTTTPSSLLKQARHIAWQFMRKATLSTSDATDFIHHSCLFACWDQLRKILKGGSENRKLFFEVEEHFIEYRAGLLRLRRRYKDEVPSQELEKFALQKLKRLRAILVTVK